MKRQFVTYKIALRLKRLGFDEECQRWANPINQVDASEIGFVKNSEDWLKFEDCALPLWQQVIDWFVEKHRINCVVGYTDSDKGEFMAIIDRPDQDIDYNMNSVKSYHKAREQAILKAIELIEDGKSN